MMIVFWKLLKKKKILFLSVYKNISISMLYAKDAGNIMLKDLLQKENIILKKLNKDDLRLNI